MRGGAPVLVALAASTLAGERLHGAQWSAVGLICAGGAVLTFGASGRTGSRASTLLALMAAVLIAGYTLVDGIGVRRSGSPAAYTAWILILGALGAIAVSWRRTEGRLPAYVLQKPGLVLLGGAGGGGGGAARDLDRIRHCNRRAAAARAHDARPCCRRQRDRARCGGDAAGLRRQ